MLWHDDLVPCLDQVVLKVMYYEVYCDSVLFGANLGPTTRHNDVCILHRWFDEFGEGGLHVSVVRFEDTLDCPTTLYYIPLQATRQPDIVIRMHENLQIKHIIDLLHIEAENAFEDDQRGPLAK